MEEKNIETMELNGNTLKELWIAAKWAKLLAIITFCLYFLVTIVIIYAGIMTSLFEKVVPFGGFFIALFYIVLYSLTALIPGLLLYNFAVNTQKAIMKDDEELAETAMKRLRTLFQYSGILALSVILMMVIIFGIGIIQSIF